MTITSCSSGDAGSNSTHADYVIISKLAGSERRVSVQHMTRRLPVHRNSCRFSNGTQRALQNPCVLGGRRLERDVFSPLAVSYSSVYCRSPICCERNTVSEPEGYSVSRSRTYYIVSDGNMAVPPGPWTQSVDVAHFQNVKSVTISSQLIVSRCAT